MSGCGQTQLILLSARSAAVVMKCYQCSWSRMGVAAVPGFGGCGL